MFNKYDIIVVGAGHAGCEAAAAAANMGSKVLLATMNMGTIGQMSCNPAIGGVAKGQIVREIDALGGQTGIITDRSTVQFRMLNLSKGPAMWSPRAQNDRQMFSEEWRHKLEGIKNIDFWQEMVVGLLIENDSVVGVKTGLGVEIKSKAVVLTNGTFLNGLIHVGEKNFGGGRSGEGASKGITEQLESFGFESGRMKTGTPPRVDGRSLNYKLMEEQPGDKHGGCFSYLEEKKIKKQLSCHITYTNTRTHELLEEGFSRSPMFNGRIKSVGPRYCPSIEDKITRFAEKERHQIFVEPEGWNTIEVYVNGFSTSLPEDIQIKALRSIKGFEEVKMFRPGYAIEYDYFPPTQLNHTLETKPIAGLYFAGQINGTTGYEEAACQGLIAGINAHNKIKGKEEFVLKRSDAYIGVLIDDLINKGTEEPYRMFTSRAEHRILLRQDNADIRLTEIGFNLGLASRKRLENLEKKKKNIDEIRKYASKTKLSPKQVNSSLKKIESSPIKEKKSLEELLRRPNVYFESIKDKNTVHMFKTKEKVEIEQVEIDIKYESYIKKEIDTVNKIQRLENSKIPKGFDYEKIKSLSAEGKEKLSKVRPKSIGQASRISGVSPSDVSVLMVYMKK